MKNFDDVARTSFAHLPTPLEPMPRLGARLDCPRLWIKRDDCTGLAVGGNKTRKLEFLIGEAQAQGADTVLTFGALQSNHARQTAAAAARAGMVCHLVLLDTVEYREPAYEASGNLLLDRLFGAKLHVAKTETQAADAVRRIVGAEDAEGRKLYVIPVGGSNATGSLGYVECARELCSQSRERGLTIGTVVTATSSTGTQAGLVAGFAALDEPVRVVGINVYQQDHAALEKQLAERVAEVSATIGGPGVAPSSLHLRHEFIGEGYGLPTPAMCEAVELVARSEGILIDPVYTGKAMAGLIALVRAGEFERPTRKEGEVIVFLHTGGTPGLFAYRDALRE
ncbi:MAG: D-cysteine desulfhydrase [bacterium]|nr:D-cysteine desulfhydrase [bacterium]